jgi:hypothetical protein
MNKRTQVNLLADRFAYRDEIERALARAVRNALIEHKRAGNPVATWENGKVVIVQPEDIVIPPDPDVEEMADKGDKL